MESSKAAAFVADNHRGVLVTHRRDGRLRTSPITVGVDEQRRIVISSRETAYKVKNLREDPRATICVFTNDFFGPWVQIEGSAEIISLPEAMDMLVDYYRRISGEHPDWDDYREAMARDQRVIIRVPIERAGPDSLG